MTGDFSVRKSLGRIITGLVGFAMLAFPATSAQAQTAGGRIVGVVTDAQSGQPLGEVQVYLPGTGLGTLTRANGRYAILNVPAGSQQVRAERIGMTAQTQTVSVTANEAAELSFQLSTQALGLDEIVVTGTAGAARRREVGSTIAQINVANMPDRPTDATKLLQAVAPGIDVAQGGGGAGQGSKIRLRGANTLSNGGDPIIYVDGVRLMTGAFRNFAAKDAPNRAANVTQSPLDMVNPNDIERIEVIKGSAATTLYGTEASNGVIQIFTKRGSSGKPVWTAETELGTMWNQRFGYCDPDQGCVVSSALVNGVRTPYPNGGTSKFLYMEPWICYGLFKCGVYQPLAYTSNQALSVRGGGPALQYFSSGEYRKDHGNTPHDQLKRWSARSNFTYAPLTELSIQWNTAYTNQGQENSPQGNNAEALELNAFRQDTNYFTNADPTLINQTLGQSLRQTIERFTTGGTATYSPLSDLTNRMTIGYDFSNHETRNIRPFGFYAHREGIIYVGEDQQRVLTFDYVGSYKFNLTAAVGSSFSWGGQAISNEIRIAEGNGSNFPGAAVPTLNSAAISKAFEERARTWNAGFFVQDVFDVANRYFLTIGTRVDGHSAFGSGFGLQVYPKASFSWVASDEPFWKQSWGDMKVRAAYGKAGRAPGAFDAVRTWENVSLLGKEAFVPRSVGSADLGPEVTTEIESGLDASWIEDRVRLAFTYYHQITDHALMDVRQLPSTGFTNNQLQNAGKIKNWGTETSLDLTAFRSANYGVDLGLNVSTNKSLILAHTNPTLIGKSITSSTLHVIVNPEAIVKDSSKVTLELPPCPSTGPLPIATPCILLNQYLGPNLPSRSISGSITLRGPKNVTLSMRGEYKGGFMANLEPTAVGRGVRSPLCLPYYANNRDVTLKSNIPALWAARCTPSLSSNNYNFDGDYAKLRNLTLTVPLDFLLAERVTSSSLSLSLNNFYTWTKESWWGTFGFENFANEGIAATGLGTTGVSANERTPVPTSLSASLRVTF